MIISNSNNVYDNMIILTEQESYKLNNIYTNNFGIYLNDIINFCEYNDNNNPTDIIKQIPNDTPVIINEEDIILEPDIVNLFENYVIKPISPYNKIYQECVDYTNSLLNEISLSGIKFGLKRKYIQHALKHPWRYSDNFEDKKENILNDRKNLYNDREALREKNKKLRSKDVYNNLALHDYHKNDIMNLDKFSRYNIMHKWGKLPKRKRINKFSNKHKNYISYNILRRKKNGRYIQPNHISAHRRKIYNDTIFKDVSNNNSEIIHLTDLIKKNKQDLKDLKKELIKNRNIDIAKKGGKIGISILGGAAAGVIAYKLLKLAKKQKSPKSFIGKKIASFRKIYRNLMIQAQKNPKKAGMLKRVAAKILKVIDQLMVKLQNMAG